MPLFKTLLSDTPNQDIIKLTLHDIEYIANSGIGIDMLKMKIQSISNILETWLKRKILSPMLKLHGKSLPQNLKLFNKHKLNFHKI